MLRKTASGTFERQESDGTWVPVTPEEARAATAGAAPEPQVEEGGVATMIDTLVDELHGDGSQNGHQQNGTVEAEPQLSESEKLAAHEEFAGKVDEPPTGVVDTESVPGDFDLEVPGLVSSDTGRSSRGFKTVRERLKENAKKRREPKRVEVGGSAAKVIGPAAREGTERRQQRRATERLEAGKSAGSTVASETGLKQRYVSRPAPELMSGRPKWVQDLFESHFRSEHTLGMRRAFNRMKISRQDYAIGWLTALDKFREQPELLRSKDK